MMEEISKQDFNFYEYIKRKVTSHDLEKKSAHQRIDWAIQNFSQNIF